MNKYRFFQLRVVFVATVLASLSLQAAPKPHLLPFWNQSDEINFSSIDHTKWASFLNRYVIRDPSGLHLVAYAQVTDSDKTMLNDYINYLQTIAIRSYRRDAQFAYWVNLYNAYTVTLILNNYPIRSIRNISNGLFQFGPWDEKYLRVEQQLLSLNDIEHGILRPIWQDKRIHYVVNCASIGCPNLAREPLYAHKLEIQLTQAQRDYVNHPRGFHFDGKVFHLSSIYDWYRTDFVTDDRQLIDSLVQLLEDQQRQEELITWLEDNPGKISLDYSYDWGLNIYTQ